jgi:hypothetical protein
MDTNLSLLPFRQIADMTRSLAELLEALNSITSQLGLHHFALTHHIDGTMTSGVIRLHNYPERWAEHYRKALVLVDPVHRRSYLTSLGFTWASMEKIAPCPAGAPDHGTQPGAWHWRGFHRTGPSARRAGDLHSSTSPAMPSRPTFRTWLNWPVLQALPQPGACAPWEKSAPHSCARH